MLMISIDNIIDKYYAYNKDKRDEYIYCMDNFSRQFKDKDYVDLYTETNQSVNNYGAQKKCFQVP